MSLVIGSDKKVNSIKNDLSGAVEGFSLTCPATAGALQADYFAFNESDGDSFAVWLDIDAAGTAPTGAVYTAASVKLEVDIITGDSASDVAGKVKAAVELSGSFNEYTITQSGAVLTFRGSVKAVIVDANTHDAADGGAGSFTAAATSQGRAGLLSPGQRVDTISNNP